MPQQFRLMLSGEINFQVKMDGGILNYTTRSFFFDGKYRSDIKYLKWLWIFT